MKKYLLPLLFFLIVAYLAFGFFYNRYRISILHYGVNANELRARLHIPVIDSYMKAKSKYNAFLGNRWESSNDFPKDNTPLHVWKTVTPLTDTSGLDDEADAYRKKYNDTLYLQMNIFSKVRGDTIAIRNGKLFFYNNKQLDIDITDMQIDSVSKSWGLKYLIRGR